MIAAREGKGTLGGSAHNGGPRDQQGEVIRFPRAKWVPEDGVEPLNGDAEDQHSPGSGAVAERGPGQSGADQHSSWPAIEASDFWASGDAQEFVGVAPMARASTPPADRHDGIPEAVAGDGGADRATSHADQRGVAASWANDRSAPRCSPHWSSPGGVPTQPADVFTACASKLPSDCLRKHPVDR